MFLPNFKRPQSEENTTHAEAGYRLEIDVPVPMRDGTQLATDLYFPVEPGIYPLLLERTPYGKHQSIMVSIQAPQFLACHGFVVAIQDTRGRYASEGTWYPFRDEAWAEKQDGDDGGEWLAAQPGSNGKVVSFGGSFAGFNQYLLAGELPPHLVALFPRQAACDLRKEWVYRGGALELGFILTWGARQSLEALRNRLVQLERRVSQDPMDLLKAWPLNSHPLFTNTFEWLHDYLERQQDREYWRQWDVSRHHASFDRPTYHMASWYDIFLGGTLRNFTGMRQGARSEKISDSHHLIIGPWLHGPGCAEPPHGRMAGEVDFGEAAQWDYRAAMLSWFDYWMKGIETPLIRQPAVRYFIMGLNQWKTAPDWPPPGISYVPLYFHERRSGSAVSLNDRTLSWHAPHGSPPPVRYVHDPNKPVGSVGGNTLFSLTSKQPGEPLSWEDLNAQAGPRDQRVIEPECLTFTSPILEEDLEVTGPVLAQLYVSSSAVDTDFIVRLCDVYPDGRSMLICDGIQRARYRESDYVPSLLVPGQIYPLSVDLWATSNLFRAGHQLRVIINSSCFPRFDVNPGTGESGISTAVPVTAENQIHLGESCPSHIILPIIR